MSTETRPVVAKFQCTAVEKTKYWKTDPQFMYNAKFNAVYDSDPNSENGRFFASTPNGNINLGVISVETAELFIPGEEYLVTFTKKNKQ